MVQTEKHEAVVKKYLLKKVWEMMQTEGNQNYEPGLAALVAKEPDPDKPPQPGAKAKSKAKGKSKAAAGGKVGVDDLKKQLEELQKAGQTIDTEPVDSASDPEAAS